MKKSILTLALLGGYVLTAFAQEVVHFTAIAPGQDDFTPYGKEMIRKKVEQIIARNNAGATSVYNAFVIEPDLNILDTKSTEGLTQNVTLMKAEFTLTARNIYDDSVYGNVVIQVTGDATGDGEAAIKSLLSGIKSTNPAFTRFIRTTRDKIVQHYNANCPTIIKKGQTMIAMGKIEDAIGYLGSVPEVVPCYEEATTIMTQAAQKAKNLECDQMLLLARSQYILKNYETALHLLSAIPSDSPCSKDARALTDSIAKRASVPVAAVVETAKETVPTPAPAPAPKKAEAPAAPAPAAPAAPAYQLSVSSPDLGFELVSCEGSVGNQSIILYCRLTNKAANEPRAYIYLETAIDGNGSTYDDWGLVALNGCNTSTYGNNMPTDIPVGKCFMIKKVAKKIDKLAYVEIKARGCKVALRDVPVTWK